MEREPKPITDTSTTDREIDNEREKRSFNNSTPQIIRELLESEDTERQGFGKALAEMCRDKGTARNTHTIFTIEGQQTVEQEPGHYMLNRTSMISRIEEEKKEKEIEVRILDVKRFGEANKIETTEESTHKPADVVISRICERMQLKADEINRDFEEQGSDVRVIVGRYGGDELALVFIGDLSEEEKETKTKEFIEEVQEVDSYYKSNGNVTKGKVIIKEKTDIITLPKEGVEREIFEARMAMGVLLTPAEIEKEKPRWEKAREEETEKVETIAPNEDRTEVETLCKDILEKAESFGIREEIKEFLEKNIIDRLLGDRVLSVSEFAIEHLEHPFKQIISFELPAKECNDYISMSVTDDGIAAMYERIKEELKGEPLTPEQIQFYRKGSTIILGISTDLELETLQKLQGITQMSIPHTQVTLPIGVGIHNTKNPNKKPEPWEVRTALNDAFDAGTKDWIERILRGNPNILQLREPLTEEEQKEMEERVKEDNFNESFFELYLYGKRFEDRWPMVRGILDRVIDDLPEHKTRLKQLKEQLDKKPER